MGTTPITLVDYDSEKIRFGWTLTDQVVDAKGALTFSVRFIETGSNDNLIYSLNTLATAVKINPALSADLIEKTDESPWLYLNAVSNGANSNSSVKPKYPKIYLDLDAQKDYSLVSDTVSLEVGAYPQDTGSLSYKWIYNHYNNQDYNKEFTTSGNYYILTTDSEKSASKTYYTREKDDTTGEYVYSECTAASFTDGKFTSGVQYYEKNIIVEIKYEKSNDQEAEEGKFYYIEKAGGGYEPLSDLTKFEVGKVFEKHVKLTICPSSNKNIAGQYHVNVINTIKGNKKTMASAKATIPAITEIKFKTDLAAAGSNNILEEKTETDDDGKTTTSYSKQLKVEQQEGLNNNCKVKYQWRSKKKESDEFANITNATTATYNATEPGWYQVRLTGELNRTEAFKDSIVAKITKPTEAPTVTKTGKPVTYELANGKTQVIAVTATVGDGKLDPKLVSDKVEYKWQYQIPEVNPPQYADAVVGENGVVSIDANKITVKFDGGEVFKCIVTNTLNDTSQSVESDKYWITGADV
jgi:hypothetical protein